MCSCVMQVIGKMVIAVWLRHLYSKAFSLKPMLKHSTITLKVKLLNILTEDTVNYVTAFKYLQKQN